MAGASLNLLFINLSSCIFLGRAAGSLWECEGEDVNRLAGRTPESIVGAWEGVHVQDSTKNPLPARARLRTPWGQAGEEDLAIYSLKDDITPTIAAEGTAQKGRAKGWWQPAWYPPCEVVKNPSFTFSPSLLCWAPSLGSPLPSCLCSPSSPL